MMGSRRDGSATSPWQVKRDKFIFRDILDISHESGQERFSGLMDNFEEYIVSNAPVVMADPEVDPYVTGSLNPSSDKARMRFSDVAQFAEEQFRALLDFRH